MLLAIEPRGRDATGLAYPWTYAGDHEGRTEHQIWHNKDGIKASDFIEARRHYSMPRRAHTGILHTRMGTGGSPKDNNNNHPIAVNMPERPAIVGVHNGVLRNEWQIWNKHPILKEAKQGQVDSQIIFQILAQYGDEGITELGLQGDASIAWLVNDRPDELHLARMGGRPLHLVRTKGGSILFTSAKENMDDALKTFPQLVIDERWDMKEGELIVVEKGEVLQTRDDWPVITPKSAYQGGAAGGQYRSGYGLGWDDDDHWGPTGGSTPPRPNSASTHVIGTPAVRSATTPQGRTVGTRTGGSVTDARKRFQHNPTIGELAQQAASEDAAQARIDAAKQTPPNRPSSRFGRQPSRPFLLASDSITMRQRMLWDYFFDSFVDDCTEHALFEGLEFLYSHVSDDEMLRAEDFVEELIREEVTEAFDAIHAEQEFEEEEPGGAEEVVLAATSIEPCLARGPLNQPCVHRKHSIEMAHQWASKPKDDAEKIVKVALDRGEVVSLPQSVKDQVLEERSEQSQAVFDAALTRVKAKAVATLRICCNVDAYRAVKATIKRLQEPGLLLADVCTLEDALIATYLQQSEEFEKLGHRGREVHTRIARVAMSESKPTTTSTELVLAHIEKELADGEGQKESD